MIAGDDKLLAEITRRLLGDDDPPQISKDVGCSLELANIVRDTLPTVEE